MTQPTPAMQRLLDTIFDSVRDTADLCRIAATGTDDEFATALAEYQARTDALDKETE